MEIKSQFEYLGKIAKAHWVEDDPLKDFPVDERLDGVHSFCFCGDKMVVVLNKKGMWTPPGGYIELGETYEDASIREIKEESNMRVVYQKCLGYQDVTDEYGNHRSRQVRMFCIVEPYGNFENDPDGDITEIKLIDSKDFNKTVGWGEIGDRILELSLEEKNKYKK